MVISQIPTPDSAGIKLLWQLLEGLSESGKGAQLPTPENGWGVAIEVFVIFFILLILAIFFLGSVLLWGIIKWRKDQASGIKALSSNKDSAKREIMGVLKEQLSSSAAATAAANKELTGSIKLLHDKYHLICLDLVVIAHKTKISLMSLPSSKPKNHEDLNNKEE